MVGAPGGSPAEALAESAFALRASVDSLRGYESEGWAHFEFTRMNIEGRLRRPKRRTCVLTRPTSLEMSWSSFARRSRIRASCARSRRWCFV